MSSTIQRRVHGSKPCSGRNVLYEQYKKFVDYPTNSNMMSVTGGEEVAVSMKEFPGSSTVSMNTSSESFVSAVSRNSDGSLLGFQDHPSKLRTNSTAKLSGGSETYYATSEIPRVKSELFQPMVQRQPVQDCGIARGSPCPLPQYSTEYILPDHIMASSSLQGSPQQKLLDPERRFTEQPKSSGQIFSESQIQKLNALSRQTAPQIILPSGEKIWQQSIPQTSVSRFSSHILRDARTWGSSVHTSNKLQYPLSRNRRLSL